MLYPTQRRDSGELSASQFDDSVKQAAAWRMIESTRVKTSRKRLKLKADTRSIRNAITHTFVVPWPKRITTEIYDAGVKAPLLVSPETNKAMLPAFSSIELSNLSDGLQEFLPNRTDGTRPAHLEWSETEGLLITIAILGHFCATIEIGTHNLHTQVRLSRKLRKGAGRGAMHATFGLHFPEGPIMDMAYLLVYSGTATVLFELGKRLNQGCLADLHPRGYRACKARAVHGPLLLKITYKSPESQICKHRRPGIRVAIWQRRKLEQRAPQDLKSNRQMIYNDDQGDP
ncbi:hypothetical protein CPC08DRAFT_789389 [Agrocybe pediades]|nr:hypothetical protein CPC08DRAFT_789389 [Agrocybe pediades]